MEPATSDPTTAHVRAACSGDLRSIEWVIRRMTPHLISQARLHLRNLPGADKAPEDLVQEVWAIAFLRLSELEPRNGRMTPVLATFLARTMRNKTLNWLRRQATAQRSGNLSATNPDVVTLSAATRDVIRSVMAKEHEDLVAQALANLDEVDREILVLRGLEGTSYDDLATLLQCEPGTLRMRYARARQRLRDRLPDSLFDEIDP